MTYVVTAACFGCKNKECLAGCPTDSFHEGENMLYIDPESCTECQFCESACPTNAIFLDVEVPANLQEFIELNAEMSKTTPSAHD